MKRGGFILSLAIFILTFYSCTCNCIHCPGMGASTGTGSDDVCRDQYNSAAGGNPSIAWETYSNNLIGMGTCTCK